MKQGRIKVYHNSKFGFLFCAETTVAGTVMKTVIDPVSTGRADLDESQLGEKILETMEQSRRALPIARSSIQDFKFWQISGIKGFAAFSKQFDCVSIFEEDSQIKIIPLVRDTDGAYFVPETQSPVSLDGDRPDLSREIGRAVLKMLRDVHAGESAALMSFETVYGRKVSYTRPSDAFAEIGDGHTDAYQVFVQEGSANNAILFLIDNEYPRLDEEAIRKRWEQLYGNLQEFTYRTIRGKNNDQMMEVSGKSKSREMIARIYCEKKGCLEVAAQMDRIHTSAKDRDQIRAEFKVLVASIQFT